MPGLIIEGPDGAGKSFTAEFLSSAVNIPIHHSGGPPKSTKEMFNRALAQTRMDNVILDRVAIISDMVYGPIIRDKTLFTDNWLKLINFPIIYCRPSVETILKSKLETKPHKDAAHLAKVEENIIKIINQYDKVMQQALLVYDIPLLKFNRDTQTLEELLSCVESILPSVKIPS